MGACKAKTQLSDGTFSCFRCRWQSLPPATQGRRGADGYPPAGLSGRRSRLSGTAPNNIQIILTECPHIESVLPHPAPHRPRQVVLECQRNLLRRPLNVPAQCHMDMIRHHRQRRDPVSSFCGRGKSRIPNPSEPIGRGDTKPICHHQHEMQVIPIPSADGFRRFSQPYIIATQS